MSLETTVAKYRHEYASGGRSRWRWEVRRGRTLVAGGDGCKSEAAAAGAAKDWVAEAERSAAATSAELLAAEVDLVGLADAADRSGVDRNTLKQWHHRGHLPTPRWSTKAGPFWHWPDLSTAITERAIGAASA